MQTGKAIAIAVVAIVSVSFAVVAYNKAAAAAEVAEATEAVKTVKDDTVEAFKVAAAAVAEEAVGLKAFKVAAAAAAEGEGEALKAFGADPLKAFVAYKRATAAAEVAEAFKTAVAAADSFALNRLAITIVFLERLEKSDDEELAIFKAQRREVEVLAFKAFRAFKTAIAVEAQGKTAEAQAQVAAIFDAYINIAADEATSLKAFKPFATALLNREEFSGIDDDRKAFGEALVALNDLSLTSWGRTAFTDDRKAFGEALVAFVEAVQVVQAEAEAQAQAQAQAQVFQTALAEAAVEAAEAAEAAVEAAEAAEAAQVETIAFGVGGLGLALIASIIYLDTKPA